MRSGGSQQQSFGGLRVVELTDHPAGELVGKLLGDLGADVVKIEPPGGVAGRQIGPFVDAVLPPDNSLHFWFYNTSKRSVVLDLESAEGLDSLSGLVRQADVFVHTLSARESKRLGLSYESVSADNPRLVVCAVTAFGQDGPWADYKTSDLIGLAAGGPLHMCGYDDLSIPPIRPGGNQAYHVTGILSMDGILLSLLEKERTGRGRFIDVSMHECMAVTVEMANPYWFYNRALVRRQTARAAQPVVSGDRRSAVTSPATITCQDGRQVYLVLSVVEQKIWQSLISWLGERGLTVDLLDDAYKDPEYRRKNYSHIEEIVHALASMLDANTFFHEAQEHALPAGIINAPEDLLTDPHLADRKFFVKVPHEELGEVTFPGAPYRFSGLEWKLSRRPPRCGEHTGEVLHEWLVNDQ